jgi:SAM-dependent methyltransferase
MKEETIRGVLEKIAKEYPANLIHSQLIDVKRIAWHLSLVINARGTDCRICDLGGGIGLFSVGAAALGMQAVLIDDFADQVNQSSGDSVLDLHRRYGVEVISRDVLKEGLDNLDGPFAAITSFESMEHWHHSPKRLFKQAYDLLEPRGLFILSVPNCINLRKRITIPFGWGQWSPMESWYEEEKFRGHVREPNIYDLNYIANDMKLNDTTIIGRNWLAYDNRSATIRGLAPLADIALRPFPTLCSNIYLVGRKGSPAIERAAH